MIIFINKQLNPWLQIKRETSARCGVNIKEVFKKAALSVAKARPKPICAADSRTGVFKKS
jgi:hypothetical protein